MSRSDTSESKKQIFFAYKGRQDGHSDENIDAIKHAITTFNRHQSTYVGMSWEEYKKTTAISHEVLAAIKSSSVFVADLTYFNHNVLFELGYAFALDKEILILLNPNIQDSKAKYGEFILKDIRYTAIVNASSIHVALQGGQFKHQLNTFINIKNLSENIVDIFYLKSKHPNQASLDLTQTIDGFKNSRNCTLVGADPTEVAYQPLQWYFNNLFKSKIAIFHMLGENVKGWEIENAKYSFYAGFAYGLDRKVLMLAPAKYRAPLDYYEILIPYEHIPTLQNHVLEWLDERFQLAPSTPAPVSSEHANNLIKLGIGCDIAEQERDTLLSYFVETSSYFAAINYEKSILVGRKGSGKSAIYIKLLKDLTGDRRNYLVTLKPESDELLADVETSDLFNSPASKRSFFFSVWKFVIYSKLLQAINDRLVNVSEHHSYSKEEKALLDFYTENKEFIHLDFFGVLRDVSMRVQNSPAVESPQILEQMYKLYLGPLLKVIQNYFGSINAKFIKVVILADNVDKTWDPKYDMDLQSEMIQTLFEAENRVRADLTDKQGCKVDVKEIIFLRKDTFEYILDNASEPDKLVSSSHEIDWERYPTLLKKLIDDRFKHILGLATDDDVEAKSWKEFFEYPKGKHPYDTILEIITKRPRDLIYFVSKLFESAIDKGRDKVTKDDYEEAITNYTKFINNNLIAEMRTQFPEIVDILSQLQEHHGERIEFSKFKTIVKSCGYNNSRIDSLVEVLFEKQYMVGYDMKTNRPFGELQTLQAKLKERRFLIIPNKVYVIAHAKYWHIKNRKNSFFK